MEFKTVRLGDVVLFKNGKNVLNKQDVFRFMAETEFWIILQSQIIKIV